MNIIKHLKNSLIISIAGLAIANTVLEGKPVTELTPEQIEQLGAIEIIVSDSPPNVEEDTLILCPLSQKDPDSSFEKMKDDLKRGPAEVTFPVAYDEKEKINVQLFTTEIVVKSLVAKKRPIIWIKEKGLSDYAKKYVGEGKKTYLVFTQYGL